MFKNILVAMPARSSLWKARRRVARSNAASFRANQRRKDLFS
jgi:hypothetical protein